MTLAISRWLGGKRWLTTGHAHLLPTPGQRGRAFDCFTGSAVVALHWLAMGVRVVIGDTNPRLIGCLRNLQERPEAVISALAEIAESYSVGLWTRSTCAGRPPARQRGAERRSNW